MCKGMTMEGSILWNTSTNGDITPMLSWDIDYSPLANDISASSSRFTEVEPWIIHASTYSCHSYLILSEFYSRGTR